jgi:hypothetical protein
MWGGWLVPCARILTLVHLFSYHFVFLRWDFIPKNLYFQFHRFANWFFLTMSLINFVPEVRTFAPMLSFLPLVLVLVAQVSRRPTTRYRRTSTPPPCSPRRAPESSAVDRLLLLLLLFFWLV